MFKRYSVTFPSINYVWFWSVQLRKALSHPYQSLGKIPTLKYSSESRITEITDVPKPYKIFSPKPNIPPEYLLASFIVEMTLYIEKMNACLLSGIVQQIHTEKDDFSCLRDYCNLFKVQACPHKANIQFIDQVGLLSTLHVCMRV